MQNPVFVLRKCSHLTKQKLSRKNYRIEVREMYKNFLKLIKQYENGMFKYYIEILKM